MHRQHVLAPLLAFVTLVLASIPALAQAPELINYQGRVVDDSGKPLDGDVLMIFTIYDDSTAGSSLWADTLAAVTVRDGLFSVILDLQGQAVAFNEIPNVYLGVRIGADSEIQPRTRLVAVPLALRVSTVNGSTGGTINGKVAVTDQMSIGPNQTNTGKYAFVAGSDNSVTQDYAAIAGGKSNLASGQYSAISGGFMGNASGNYSFVGGGLENTASGLNSAVLGGDKCVAAGVYSIAMGNRAKAWHDGSVVIVANLCPL